MSFSKTWTPTADVAIASPASTAVLSATAFCALIKAYKTAGWTVDGSSNGGRPTVTDSAGSKTIAFVSGTTWQLTDTTSAGFLAEHVGNLNTFSGFANGGNNHPFRVVGVASSTVLTFDAGGFTPVAETAASGAHWSIAADASSTDGVDRLSSGPNNFVWGTSGGAAHWWIILKSPAALLASGNRVWKVYAGSTGVGSPHLYNYWHSSATHTSGTTTTDPTAAANTAAKTNKNIVPSASTANHKWRQTTSSVGDVVFILSRDGTGYAAYVAGAASATLQNEAAGDYDVAMFETYVDSGRGGFQVTSLQGTTMQTMFYKDATVLGNADWVNPQRSGAGVMGSGNFGTAGTSNVSGITVDFPIALFGYETAKTAWKGQLSDFAWAPQPSSSIQAKSDPNTASTINSVVIGDVFVPMPGLTSDPSF